MKTPIFKKGKKSEALVSSIIVLALVFGVIVLMHLRSRSLQDTAGLQVDADKAYALAKSGIGIGESFIPTENCDPIHKLYSLGGSETITIDIDPCKGTLTSTGKAGKSIRVAKKTFPPVTPGEPSGPITFAKAYNGLNTNLDGWMVQPLSDNSGYVCSGNSSSSIVLIKTDSLGNALWGKTYGSSGFDTTQKMLAETFDGGYMLGGQTTSFGSDYQYLLINTDSNGTSIWNKTYGGSKKDYLGWILRTTVSPGYILAGWTDQYATTLDTTVDPLFIKTGIDGTIVWAYNYNGTIRKNDLPNSVRELNNGSYITVGWTNSFSSSNEDIYMMELNPDGTIAWQRCYRYTSSKTEKPRDVMPTSDGGWLIGAVTNTFEASSSNYDTLVIKTNATGVVSWAKTYGVAGVDDRAEAIYETGDGTYALAGVTKAGGNYDLLLFKIDSNGNLLSGWPKTYGGSGTEHTYIFGPTSNGGLALMGDTTSFGTGYKDLFLVKTDASGEIPNCNIVNSTSFTVTNRAFTDATVGFTANSRSVPESPVSMPASNFTVITTPVCSQ